MDLESQRLKLLASIHELEQTSAEKTARLRKLEQEYNQVIERIRYEAHGSTLFDPLVNFPPEIWIPIIQHATDRVIGWGHISALATLCSCMLVSKRWHKYITETPILWSNINLSDDESSGQDTAILLATFLHYSQACELDIIIPIPFASWEMVRDRIAVHRSRIRSIHLLPVFLYYTERMIASYRREAGEMLRFLSPLSHSTGISGLFGEINWLLEEAVSSTWDSLSLNTLSLPAAQNLRQIRTEEDIRSIIPLMKNLLLVQNVTFNGIHRYLTADIPSIEPRDVDFAGLGILDWVSLAYSQDHLHFPVWLLTRLPNLVYLKLTLWSMQLTPLLTTVNCLTLLNNLSLEIHWSLPLQDLPSETFARCPSLRLLRVDDQSSFHKSTSAYLKGFLELLVNTFSNVSDLIIMGKEIISTYMFMKSNGFQKLELLDISQSLSHVEYPLLEGKAWFPPSLQKLYIVHTEFTFTQVYSPTIECLDVSMGYDNNRRQELSLDGWPKLQKLTIDTRNVLLQNSFHQNLREIRLRSTIDMNNSSYTRFCRDIALYPSNLPSLRSISLYKLPEWDIFFIMLERKNFCSQPGVARIDRVELHEVYPTRFLKPLRDLLSGRYTKRPSNLDLSIVGNADIIFDPSIPGCMECHLALRPCESKWGTPQGLKKLGSSLPLYPDSPQDILLTWNERATWWKHVDSSKFGRKESCSSIEKVHPEWVVSYN